MDQQFVQRKQDHIQYALSEESQTSMASGLDQIELIHHSLPDLNLDEISLSRSFLDVELSTPFFVSGMTAGHENAQIINHRIAEMASARGWLMGVGSQRRELDESYQDFALRELSSCFPKLKLISNLGIAQLIELHQKKEFSKLVRLIEQTGAVLIAIHLNPLQEAIQAEGTPRFKGGMSAIREWLKVSPVPVVLKETGSGMSDRFIQELTDLQLFAMDVSGMGGTHWGRIEGLRAKPNSLSSNLGATFADWGVSTVQSLQNASRNLKNSRTEIWASGGMRSGLDAAKAIALGAKRVGFAQPVLIHALKSETALHDWANQVEQELKIAMFCTNSPNLDELNHSKWKGKC